MVLLERKRPGNPAEAERLLRKAQAEAEAEMMKLPEAAQIQGILSRLSAPPQALNSPKPRRSCVRDTAPP